MSAWDCELTTQQKCPLLTPSIPHAVQDDFSSTADDLGSTYVLDLGDEFKVTQTQTPPKSSWKLKYRDFLPASTNNWDKSETFQ